MTSLPSLSTKPYFLLSSTLAKPSEKLSASSYFGGMTSRPSLSTKPHFPLSSTGLRVAVSGMLSTKAVSLPISVFSPILSERNHLLVVPDCSMANLPIINNKIANPIPHKSFFFLPFFSVKGGIGMGFGVGVGSIIMVSS